MLGDTAGQLVLFMGLGVQELLIIFLAVVFLFGAKKIPEIARGLGKGLNEFKKGQQESDTDEGKEKKPDRTRDMPDTSGEG